jgi:hypothetical protein
LISGVKLRAESHATPPVSRKPSLLRGLPLFKSLDGCALADCNRRQPIIATGSARLTSLGPFLCRFFDPLHNTCPVCVSRRRRAPAEKSTTPDPTASRIGEAADSPPRPNPNRFPPDRSQRLSGLEGVQASRSGREFPAQRRAAVVDRRSTRRSNRPGYQAAFCCRKLLYSAVSNSMYPPNDTGSPKGRICVAQKPPKPFLRSIQ